VSLRRRSPRPLSAAMDQIRDELAPHTLLADAQRAWPQAVGAAIANEARPTGERGGTLTISCSASVWAQELDLMGPTIVKRLNSLLREGQIAGLRCIAVPVRDDL
jgi:predicted nucleic acid-binding Zn ribbon protein